MCKIGILLLDRDFEHDIYELIKAFYPEGDIHSLYEKDEEEYDIFFTVKKENDNFVIKYETKDQKGVASAEVIPIPIMPTLRRRTLSFTLLRPALMNN